MTLQKLKTKKTKNQTNQQRNERNQQRKMMGRKREIEKLTDEETRKHRARKK